MPIPSNAVCFCPILFTRNPLTNTKIVTNRFTIVVIDSISESAWPLKLSVKAGIVELTTDGT